MPTSATPFGPGLAPRTGPGPLLVPALLTGMVLVPLNSTMIAVGLDAIAKSLRLSVADVVWVVSAYLITMAVVQPLGGRAGDLLGHRRMFLLGAAVFWLGSLFGAASASLDTLLAARCLQALGAGVLATNGTAILRRSYPHTLPRVLGNVGLWQSMSAAVGPLLGSLLIGRFGWSSIFWINLPVLFGTVVLGLLVLPADAAGAARARIDAMGAAAAAAMLVGATLALKNLATWGWLLLPSALIGFGFVRHERRTPVPVIQLKLFQRPGFWSANLSILAANGIMYSLLLWTPLFLRAHGTPLPTVGLLLLGYSSMSSLASFGGSRLLSRGSISRGALVRAAFAITAAAMLLALALPATGRLWADVAVLLAAGLGVGLGSVAMQSTALLAAARDEAGAASGIYSTFRYIGSILASAAIAWLAPVPAVYLMVLGGVALFGIAAGFGYPPAQAVPEVQSA
jgi:MFS family permease